MLHKHEFDVTLALFSCCLILNGCCLKKSYDVAAGIFLFVSRCFDVANINFFFVLKACTLYVAMVRPTIGRPALASQLL